MALCDLCGETLDADEVEDLGDRQVCHDCRYDGLKALKEQINKLRKVGRDRLQSKRRVQEASDDQSSDESGGS